jgi:hypothetical protein
VATLGLFYGAKFFTSVRNHFSAVGVFLGAIFFPVPEILLVLVGQLVPWTYSVPLCLLYSAIFFPVLEIISVPDMFGVSVMRSFRGAGDFFQNHILTHFPGADPQCWRFFWCSRHFQFHRVIQSHRIISFQWISRCYGSVSQCHRVIWCWWMASQCHGGVSSYH